MLLVVVVGSVVDLVGWRVASDEGQYAASCCHGQRYQLGWLESCKRRGTIRCFLLLRAALPIWMVGELQLTRVVLSIQMASCK